MASSTHKSRDISKCNGTGQCAVEKTFETVSSSNVARMMHRVRRSVCCDDAHTGSSAFYWLCMIATISYSACPRIGNIQK